MSIERRTTGTGQVRYDVRIRRSDGTQLKKAFKTKREAQRFESKMIADRDQGQWVDPHAGRLPFQEWAEEWYAMMLNSWRPATAARHRVALDQYWIPELGTTRLSSITPRQIQTVLNGMAERLKPSTIRSYYGTVRNLFGDAAETDLISRSPCRGIKLPSARSNEKRVVTPAELHRLAEAVDEEWKLLIYLGGIMGLRFGEAIALRVSDLDLETGRVSITRTVSEVGSKVRIGPPKTATSIRTIIMPAPLTSEARRHIEDMRLDGNELLFPDTFGSPIRRTNFRNRIWTQAVQALGLDGLTFHGLRHSAATEWIAEGVDARTVQHLLGHADPRLVLRLYAHSTDEATSLASMLVGARYWQPEK